MELRDLIEDWCEKCAPDEPLLFADGFDAAFIGVGYRAGDEPVVCYDADECIRILMLERDMSHQEAIEYFDFNVASAFFGPKTPIFINRFKLPRPEFSRN